MQKYIRSIIEWQHKTFFFRIAVIEFINSLLYRILCMRHESFIIFVVCIYRRSNLLRLIMYALRHPLGVRLNASMHIGQLSVATLGEGHDSDKWTIADQWWSFRSAANTILGGFRAYVDGENVRQISGICQLLLASLCLDGLSADVLQFCRDLSARVKLELTYIEN